MAHSKDSRLPARTTSDIQANVKAELHLNEDKTLDLWWDIAGRVYNIYYEKYNAKGSQMISALLIASELGDRPARLTINSILGHLRRQ